MAKRRNRNSIKCQMAWHHHARTPLETEAWHDFMARRHEISKGPVTLNQALLGDPVPGRSALDRRQGV